MKQLPAILFFLLFSFSSFAGGGWPQPRKGGYFKLSQSFLRAGQYFSPDGTLLPITTTSIYMTTIYGEYGITDRLTGLLNAPLFVRSTINNRESTITGIVEPGDALNGVGDIEFGIKYGLLTQGPVVLSASLLLKLPTGNNVGGTTELLQTGDGAFSQLIKMEASHSFYPTPIYATLATGYRHRGSATYDYALGEQDVRYSDEFRWGGEVGWTPRNWLLALKWEQVVPLDNGSEGGETGSSSIFGNKVAYFGLIPEVNYIFNSGFGISASVGAALSGKNILGSPNFAVGVFYTFSGKD